MLLDMLLLSSAGSQLKAHHSWPGLSEIGIVRERVPEVSKLLAGYFPCLALATSSLSSFRFLASLHEPKRCHPNRSPFSGGARDLVCGLRGDYTLHFL